MDKSKKHKRKLLNFSVNRGMQLRMIGKITGILFLCLFVTSLTYYYFANQEINESFMLYHIKARNFLDFLLPAVVASFAVSFMAGVIAALFFPKNYAGGLYGIERDLKKLIDGDINVRVKLRQGDDAIPLADTVNELVDCFSGKIYHIKAELSKAQKILDSETEMPPEKCLAELRIIHNRLMEDMKQLEVAQKKDMRLCF